MAHLAETIKIMTNKKLLHTFLENYQPTETEHDYKERMLSFLEQHDNCFERSLLVGHFTASAWLLNKERTHALLMHHAKLNMWMQLGGHCDGNSDPLEVAIKETQEESGILGVAPMNNAIFDIDIHRIPAYKDVPEHDHFDVRFLLAVTSDEDVVKNHESYELRWISQDRNELPTQKLSVTRMFDKWIKQS